MTVLRKIREDYKVFRMVHQGNALINFMYLPSFKIVLIFRLSQLFNSIYPLKPLAYLCTVANDFFHGVWIGPNVDVGKGFYLGHPRGLVVNPGTIIGDYCSIIQQVTLGGPRTRIGNFVSINAGAKVISDPLKSDVVSVGDNCIIAAGAVVLKSVPSYSIVAGVPATVVKTILEEDNWIVRRGKINSTK